MNNTMVGVDLAKESYSSLYLYKPKRAFQQRDDT
jgi:hypothetical protein